MKYPKQKDFIDQLDELLSLYHEGMRDRFFVDEQELLIDKFCEAKNIFINKWFPSSKENQEKDF